MMLKQTSKEFKRFILLQITRELIKNSNSAPFYEIEKAVKEEEKQEVELIKHEIDKEEKTREFSQIVDKSVAKARPLRKKPLRILTIPETKLPPQFSYLRPTPKTIEVGLGRLDPLINDPAVRFIECNGPDQEVTVKTPTPKKTGIILTKEEIDEIIETVSKAAKVPVHEGVFRVSLGNIIFSAIISEVIGSKFIIKKLSYAPRFRSYTGRRGFWG